MSLLSWGWWLLLALALLLGELLTFGFFLLCLALGAFFAGIASALGVSSLLWQGLVACAGALAALGVFKSQGKKMLHLEAPAMNVYRLLGKEGVVLEAIDNNLDTGRVRIAYEDWKACSQHGEKIAAGARIKVAAIDGAALVVCPVKENEGGKQ